MKIKRDRVYGCIFLAISAFVFYAISTIVPIIAVSSEDSGPKFFPTLLNIGFALCGLGLIIMPGKDGELYLQGKQWIKILKYFALLMVYVIGMGLIGFKISTAVCLFIMIRMLAEKKPPVWLVAVYSIAFSLIVFYAFNNILEVILPRGSLFM